MKKDIIFIIVMCCIIVLLLFVPLRPEPEQADTPEPQYTMEIIYYGENDTVVSIRPVGAKTE